MDIIYYLMIFAMGTVFGSFFTLAVYRIPLKLDITHERSFCPKCNHKLGFWDMIPIFSYIFSKGRCRYCHEKIRIRYLILEILSGFVFLIQYLALNMHFPNFEIGKIALFVMFVSMYITIAIVSGIDKEYRKVNISVVWFGFICEGLYILYLYIVEHTIIYRYGMYLCLMILIYIINLVCIKKMGESKYMLEVLMFLSYIASTVEPEIFYIILFTTLILIFIYRSLLKIINKIKDKPDILHENNLPKIKIAFFIGISAVLVNILETFITNR